MSLFQKTGNTQRLFTKVGQGFSNLFNKIPDGTARKIHNSIFDPHLFRKVNNTIRQTYNTINNPNIKDAISTMGYGYMNPIISKASNVLRNGLEKYTKPYEEKERLMYK